MNNFINYIKFYALSFFTTLAFIVDLTYLNCINIVWNVNIENFILFAIFIINLYLWLKTSIKYTTNFIGVTLNFFTIGFLTLLYSGVFVLFGSNTFENILARFIEYSFFALCALQVIKLIMMLFPKKHSLIKAPNLQKINHIQN